MKHLFLITILLLSLIVCAEARHARMSHVSSYDTFDVPKYTVPHVESGHDYISHPTGRTDDFGNIKWTKPHSEL